MKQPKPTFLENEPKICDDCGKILGIYYPYFICIMCSNRRIMSSGFWEYGV